MFGVWMEGRQSWVITLSFTWTQGSLPRPSLGPLCVSYPPSSWDQQRLGEGISGPGGWRLEPLGSEEAGRQIQMSKEWLGLGPARVG